MPASSIRQRLIFTMVLCQALLALALVFTGVDYTHRRLQAALDADLHARAMGVAALVRYPEETNQPLVFEATLVPAQQMAAGDLFEVMADGVGVVGHSPNWPPNVNVAAGGKRYRKLEVAGVPYRVLRLDDVPILDREETPLNLPSTLTVIYAMSQAEMNRQVWRAGMYIALASLAFLGITVVMALWGIGRGLLPLQHLATEASHVTAEHWDFQPLPEAELVAELRPLAEGMETMLQRLRQSFEHQRQFLGNAAHELKTPVAILKSTMQSLLQRPRTSTEYQAGLAQSLEDVERLEKLIQGMLRLARAEQWAYGTLKRNLDTVDVAGTCEDAIEGLRSLVHAHDAHIKLQAEDGILCRADPEDLEVVWNNLLENAVRYSPRGATINIYVRRGDHRARVVVEDHGPGIPADELPLIFERFQRGDTSRTRATGGFGLGLAIAKALVEAYGGTITPESTVGQGTRIIVDLPLNLN